VSHITT